MAGKLGFSAELKYKDPEQVIGHVFNIEPFEVAADDIDVTTHQSANKTREFIAGLIDSGEVTVEFLLDSDDGGQNKLIEDVGGEADTFVLTLPGDIVWEFSAYVRSYSPGAPLDDRMTGTSVLKLTGETTLAS